ncbi:MAG: DUF5615 family PIN-like protein [Thermomicrobiales bacterium]
MRFLIDESADARVAAYLDSLGHEATTVARAHGPGWSDESVLALALNERRILITDDRDFGELVFVEHQPHAGVIYFRLGTSVLSVRLARLDVLLARYVIVTRHLVRVRGIDSASSRLHRGTKCVVGWVGCQAQQGKPRLIPRERNLGNRHGPARWYDRRGRYPPWAGGRTLRGSPAS